MTQHALRPILIAGPTASGKSALASAIAERVGGVIVNADSMQVYAELRILTARPTPEDEARAPHRLYGHISATQPYSVAHWLEDVRQVLWEAHDKGWRPIIVGGTGLYFKALLEGLSPIPAIPDAVRGHWRSEAGRSAPNELYAQLIARDPIMAARLAPGDTQRVTRALEIIDATGRSLADWQRIAGTPLLLADETSRLVVDLPRATLQERADRRVEEMMAAGAVDEVRALLRLDLACDAPAMRALGVAPLAQLIAHRVSRSVAVDQTRLATRQYLKRQQTWIKRHMMSWNQIILSENCLINGNFMQFIDR